MDKNDLLKFAKEKIKEQIDACKTVEDFEIFLDGFVVGYVSMKKYLRELKEAKDKDLKDE